MQVEQISIKPIIRELVRTKVCFPNLKLLVDRVSIIKLPHDGGGADQEAYCLCLTDREKTIKAIIKSRLHKRVHRGEVKEGSFVVLKDYQLARGTRLNAAGEVIYLRISDFYSIGEEARDHDEIKVLEDLGTVQSDPNTRQELPTQGPQTKDSASFRVAETNPSAQDHMIAENEGSSPEPSASPKRDTAKESCGEKIPLSQLRPSEKRKRNSASSEPDSSPHKRGQESEIPGSGRENKAGSAVQSASSRLEYLHSDAEKADSTHVQIPRRNSDPLQTGGEDATELAVQDSCDMAEPSSAVSKFPATNFPPISGVNKISTLASVTGANRSKNEVHDFLAVIIDVDAHTYKPPKMPRKRDLRIMDTSTSKQVVLSVFTDPVNFEPEVGTIAVFRHLTTHNWDGGNLKAYPWLCEGKAWFVPVERDGLIDDLGKQDIDGLWRLRDSVIGHT